MFLSRLYFKREAGTKKYAKTFLFISCEGKTKNLSSHFNF